MPLSQTVTSPIAPVVVEIHQSERLNAPQRHLTKKMKRNFPNRSSVSQRRFWRKCTRLCTPLVVVNDLYTRLNASQPHLVNASFRTISCRKMHLSIKLNAFQWRYWNFHMPRDFNSLQQAPFWKNWPCLKNAFLKKLYASERCIFEKFLRILRPSSWWKVAFWKV